MYDGDTGDWKPTNSTIFILFVFILDSAEHGKIFLGKITLQKGRNEGPTGQSGVT